MKITFILYSLLVTKRKLTDLTKINLSALQMASLLVMLQALCSWFANNTLYKNEQIIESNSPVSSIFQCVSLMITNKKEI